MKSIPRPIPVYPNDKCRRSFETPRNSLKIQSVWSGNQPEVILGIHDVNGNNSSDLFQCAPLQVSPALEIS
jgi:hypothetical protein